MNRWKVVASAMLWCAGWAWAQAPGTLGYQGRLYTASGEPQSGVASIRFSIHSAPTGGTELWNEMHSVGLSEGFYSVFLGDSTPLSNSVFDGSERYLELSVGGVALTPRQRIASVAYARSCTTAQSVASSGVINAGGLQVGGAMVVDSSGKIVVSALPPNIASNTSGTSSGFTGMLSGEVTGGQSSTVVSQVQGIAVSQVSPPSLSSGMVLRYNGSQWATAPLTVADVRAGTAGGSITMPPGYVPVNDGDVTTKAYVDAASGGAAGSCYYVFDNGGVQCALGYDRAPGQYTAGSAAQAICCPSTASASGGALVMTQTTYTGILGGMAGASAQCLTELTAKEWLGKSRYTLSASNVRAFLCDATTCNNLQPLKMYSFARAGNIDTGGTAFSTDQFGRGPRDTAAWDSATVFGTGATYFWTGRGAGVGGTLWSLGPGTGTCAGWTANSGGGTQGYTNGANQYRWNQRNDACTNMAPLVCIVD